MLFFFGGCGECLIVTQQFLAEWRDKLKGMSGETLAAATAKLGDFKWYGAVPVGAPLRKKTLQDSCEACVGQRRELKPHVSDTSSQVEILCGKLEDTPMPTLNPDHLAILKEIASEDTAVGFITSGIVTDLESPHDEILNGSPGKDAALQVIAC